MDSSAFEFGDLDEATPEWDALALRLGASPFSRPGWFRAWWGAFGRSAPRIGLLRRDGELTGVLR
jgi:CelD/BcsL family acetyltransferase involved in cellulose biosynthesis